MLVRMPVRVFVMLGSVFFADGRPIRFAGAPALRATTARLDRQAPPDVACAERVLGVLRGHRPSLKTAARRVSSAWLARRETCRAAPVQRATTVLRDHRVPLKPFALRATFVRRGHRAPRKHSALRATIVLLGQRPS